MGFHTDWAELQGTMAQQPKWYIAATQQAGANNLVQPSCEADSCKDPNLEVTAAFPLLAESM